MSNFQKGAQLGSIFGLGIFGLLTLDRCRFTGKN
jgi:hypothetical protein